MSQAQSTQPAHSSQFSRLNYRSGPLCHVAMRERYAGILADLTGQRFAVEECPNCGLGQTQPRPVDMDVYGRAAYYRKRHGITNWMCVRRRPGLVRRQVGAGTGRRLLDFGCGDGSFLLTAREKGWDCCEVEWNPPASVPHDLSG